LRVGKSTLLKAIATYKIPDLMHMKIILVDQQVEGDDYTPIEWLLRSDVERTSLLEEEAKFIACLNSDIIPPEVYSNINNSTTTYIRHVYLVTIILYTYMQCPPHLRITCHRHLHVYII
jgi:hypothetical protein